MTTNDAVDHVELSRRFSEQAEEEFEANDLLQASEKGWASVAQALKSIAEQRGWVNNEHALLFLIARQLSEEWGRPDMYRRFALANGLHSNFYQDVMDAPEVREGLDNAKVLLAQLEDMRTDGPPPGFAPTTTLQQDRLKALAGQQPLRDSDLSRRRNRRRR